MATGRSIQRAAAETGVSADTLRYYEKVGILPGIPRSASGHRRFHDADLGWIRIVQCLRATGMPIEDLHRYAVLMQQGDQTAGERLQILERHRRRIQDDMRELATALELVEAKIDSYHRVLAAGVNVDPPGHLAARRKVRMRSPATARSAG